MRDTFKYIIILLMVMIFQVSFFSRLPAADYGPDLFLVVVFSAGFLNGIRKGSLVGLIAGLIQDVLLGGGPGIYTISRIIIGATAGKIRGNFYPHNLPLLAGVIFAFSVLHEILIFLLSENVIFRVGFGVLVLEKIIPIALYTMFVGTLLYLLINYLQIGGGVQYEEEN